MSIFDSIKEFDKSNSDYKKAEFLKLVPGKHFVRLILEPFYTTFIHYDKMVYVECLGDDCPICARNKVIWAQYKKEAVAHGAIWPNQRFAFNVLDRTPAIICPKEDCKEEVKAGADGKFPTTCPKCGTSLLKPDGKRLPATPLNKVRLFTCGKELMTKLKNYNETELYEDGHEKAGEPIGVENFDIQLLVQKINDKNDTTPIAMPERRDIVEIDPESLWDVTKTVTHLSAGEIGELEHGVKLVDIYRARSKTTEVKEETGEIPTEIKNTLDGLFEN